jgi:hypothetical protein
MGKWLQGFFKPRNIKKYKGNIDSIRYLSSWELSYMIYLDDNKDIIEWSSESTPINYISPLDLKRHTYLPDFKTVTINKNGERITTIIEIKPLKQCSPPVKKKKITKKYITEVRTWGINEAKFKAAEAYCKKKGWKFKIITEVDLFNKGT